MYIADFPNSEALAGILRDNERTLGEYCKSVLRWLDSRIDAALAVLGVTLSYGTPDDHLKAHVILTSIARYIDSESAYKQYAAHLGKSDDQLTLLERQRAILSAIAKAGPFAEHIAAHPPESALSGDYAALLSGDVSATYWLPITVVGLYFAVDNPKEHDIGGLIESIERHGYRDKVTFDKNLRNVGETGEGAFASGNGQSFALLQMYLSGDYTAPRGVKVDEYGVFGDSGLWYLPVEFGLDAADELSARAFVLDHNNLTLLGGAFGLGDIAKIYDLKKLERFTLPMRDSESMSVTLDNGDLDKLAEWVLPTELDDSNDDESGDSEPSGGEDEYDYKCPNCAHTWSGSPK